MKKIFWALLGFCTVAAAEVVVSPNMNLPVPVVGSETGPDWANDINSCMGAIDSHDHTPGKGVPISSAAININADLSMNGSALTAVKDVAFTPQASISTTESIYVVAPDLFYNDGNGNSVRITQNGAVTGASGTITGLPSGSASASYQSGTGTFQFQSATSTPANGSFASLTIAPQTASPNGITIKSPNPLSASYNFTLPTSVPAFTSLLTMSTSGSLATVPYHVPTQQRFTAGSGTYSLPTGPSPTYIRIRMVGAGGGGGSSGVSGCGSSSNGSASTTFGTSLLTATVGAGGGGCGGAQQSGGAGGTGTINSPAFGTTIGGGSGTGGGSNGASSFFILGGAGGSSAFGGGGGSTGAGGIAGGANSGAGGGGAPAGTTSGSSSGAGGGAGGFVDAIITGPSSSYSYVVGTGGSGAGSSGTAGGTGGDGYIEVTEYYQ